MKKLPGYGGASGWREGSERLRSLEAYHRQRRGRRAQAQKAGRKAWPWRRPHLPDQKRKRTWGEEATGEERLTTEEKSARLRFSRRLLAWRHRMPGDWAVEGEVRLVPYPRATGARLEEAGGRPYLLHCHFWGWCREDSVACRYVYIRYEENWGVWLD